MIKIHTLTQDGTFLSNCYLIESSGEWAVVDPSMEYEKALSEHPEMQGRVKLVLITHAHFDHIYSIKEWMCENPRVKIGADDAAALSDPYKNCFLGFMGVEDGYYGEYDTVTDGDVIKLGEDTIEVISTPGHTPGGVCYKIGTSVFVGDTIFARGGYGRCDLPGGNRDALSDSLFKLFAKMLVGRFYPGHGPSETFNEAIKYFI